LASFDGFKGEPRSPRGFACAARDPRATRNAAAELGSIVGEARRTAAAANAGFKPRLAATLGSIEADFEVAARPVMSATKSERRSP
jgi:hypothetical protein